MLRTDYLLSLTKEQKMQVILTERVKLAKDYKYLIEEYFPVYANGEVQKFKLYPHQIDALNAFLTYQNNITMKTRQMGFTSFTAAYIACCIINNPNFKVLIISKETNSAMEFVRKIKLILDYTRKNTRISDKQNSKSWLVPEYVDGYNNKKSFMLTNNSMVISQGNTEDSGRGEDAVNLAVVDEVAFIDRKSPQRMEEIWAALGPALSTVKGKSIMISTPFGSSGWYYNTYINHREMGFNVIEAHWKVHPIFNKGMYKWIKDPTRKAGGYIAFFNKEWPDEIVNPENGKSEFVSKTRYKFVCDGRIRSPWYDAESRKLGPRKTARELDCTFGGTGGEVLPTELLQEIDLYTRGIKYKQITKRGILSHYREYKKYNEAHKYVLSCDVMTGDGSDYSTVVILDLDTLEICGTMKIQVQPKYFAQVIKELSERFGKCQIVVENQGGGGTTLQELKEMHVPNIYYSVLNKKDESIGVKKRKIGLWQSDETRTKGGDELEVLLIERELNIPCNMLAIEFYTWIWDKSGKRNHASGKHDDLIMALQNAVYYRKYVYMKNIRNRANFRNVFAVQRNNGDIDELNNIKDYNPYKVAGGMLKKVSSSINKEEQKVPKFL